VDGVDCGFVEIADCCFKSIGGAFGEVGKQRRQELVAIRIATLHGIERGDQANANTVAELAIPVEGGEPERLCPGYCMVSV